MYLCIYIYCIIDHQPGGLAATTHFSNSFLQVQHLGQFQLVAQHLGTSHGDPWPGRGNEGIPKMAGVIMGNPNLKWMI